MRVLLVEDHLQLATSTALIYVSCTHGLGQHRQTLPLDHAAQALKYLVVQMQLALTAGCVGQISIAITMFAIVVTKLQRLILRGVILSVIITKALSMTLVFTRCDPIERLWLGDLVEGSCEDFDSLVHFWMFSSGRFCLVLGRCLAADLSQYGPRRWILFLLLCLCIYSGGCRWKR